MSAGRSARSLLVACIVFVLTALAAASLVAGIQRDRLQHERTLIGGYAKDHAEHIGVYIARALSATYALATLVRVGNGSIPNFDDVAAQMLPLYPGASELALAAGGKIQSVAPLRGNEKAIGLDILSDPAQGAEAALSRESGQLTLTGPLDLVQGGLALVGRLPVSLGDAAGQPQFWGFTEVVMRLPQALAPAQLSQLTARGYDYQLWRIQPQTGKKQLIDVSSNARLTDPVEETLQVPNGIWTLSIAPVRGWGDPVGLTLRGGIGLVFSLLLAYVTKLLLDLQARGQELEALVVQRTSDIVASKNQLKATLDAIPDLVWLKDANGVYLSCNPQFERFFGAKETQIVGKTDYDFVDRQLADAFAESDRTARSVDKLRAKEQWLTFADTGYRGAFETIKTPMRDGKGGLIGVLGIARDVTERKRAEEAMQKSRTRLTVTLEATQIGIWDWDIEHDHWHASPTYFTTLGYKHEPGPSDRKIWMERVHPDDVIRVQHAIDAALALSSGPYEYEARMRHADGTYRWMSVRGKVVERDERGLPTRLLGVRIDITDHKNAEERIRRLAHFDALTGLPNRTLLNDRVGYAIGMAQRNDEPIAILVLGIDKFKNVNDTLGHRIGDELLMEVAKRIKSLIREDDTIARIGGDEFILVSPGTDANRSAHIARELLQSLAEPYRIAQLELVVTPSIGIAMYPSDGKDFDALLKCADTAMHRAKDDGRNNYLFFTAQMQATSARTLLLENALRRALERTELQLHYQPQISLGDGRICGAEALLRWTHPGLGTVTPTEFIPVAEDSGQILQIGEWVLRTAVGQLRRWMDAGLAPMTMAVNLSSVQFRHPNLPALIRQILMEAQVPPHCLELELTERVAMGDPLAAITVMNNLHQLGVRMSIDDFGTGYSSLNYLKRFQTYKLKIDQSFVSGVTDDADDRGIVSAIINLAAGLDLRTIAEGVETSGQLQFLIEQGCHEAQGYYFSKALPAESFEAFVRDTAAHSKWLQ